MNKWCRLHTDIRSNYKINQVSPLAFKTYFMFLTLETDGSLERKPPQDWLAHECRLTVPELQAVIAELQEWDLLTDDCRVVNFRERQYLDYKGAQRAKVYRERKAKRDASRDASRDVSRDASRTRIRDRIKKEDRDASRSDQDPKISSDPTYEADLAKMPLPYEAKP